MKPNQKTMLSVILPLGILGLILSTLLMPYPWHASCWIRWSTASSCSQVSERLLRQIQLWEGAALCPNTTSEECPAMPCGQKCLYTVVSSTKEKIVAEHRTPVARYVDDLTFSLTETPSGCQIGSYSTARTWYAVLDFSTNYCNLRNLAEGAGITSDQGFSELTSNSVCTQYEARDCSRY